MKTSDYYEDAGDQLSGFRATNRGATIVKNGKDPFDSDPDVIQSVHDEKLKQFDDYGIIEDNDSDSE